MMTYIKFLKYENGFVTYEYGKDKENMIGTVTTEVSNKENCKFVYYEKSEIKKFCTHTANTVTMIYRFINQNDFPREYIYAC